MGGAKDPIIGGMKDPVLGGVASPPSVDAAWEAAELGAAVTRPLTYSGGIGGPFCWPDVAGKNSEKPRETLKKKNILKKKHCVSPLHEITRG
jgi:hypothetical protein